MAPRCRPAASPTDHQTPASSAQMTSVVASIATPWRPRSRALAAIIGATHVERNGHHYVNGMHGLPEDEQRAFLRAHEDLYEHSHGAVRLRITHGDMHIRSLAGPGYASGAMPQWNSMRRTL